MNRKEDIVSKTNTQDFYEYANEIMRECFQKADEEADALFGPNETLPQDEEELIFSFSDNATLPEKLQALTELRASRGILSN